MIAVLNTSGVPSRSRIARADDEPGGRPGRPGRRPTGRTTAPPEGLPGGLPMRFAPGVPSIYGVSWVGGQVWEITDI